jgi:hypothetical protein
MASVCMALSLSSARKRLTGAASRPNGSVIWPASQAEGVAPTPNPGEEVALGVAAHVVGLHVFDAPLIHVSRGDVPSGDQIP